MASNDPEKGLPKFVLDRFSVQRQIGQGAYGLVYEATDKHKNTKVALKRCVKVLTNTTDAQRTLREIAILTELRKAHHPNIVEMTHALAVPRTKSDLYLAFEFFEGDMRSGIRSAHFRNHDAVMRAAAQVACGLAFIEACGLIHLDLKPENLLVHTKDEHGELLPIPRIAIADFGLARPQSSRQRSEDLSELSEGTLPYMAPELLLEIAPPSQASDAWALGVIFGELFCSKSFIKGRTKTDTLRSILCILGAPSDSYTDKLESEFLPACLELERICEDIEQLDPEPGSLDAWANVFTMAKPIDIELMRHLLAMDPEDRFTAVQVLEHPAIAPYVEDAAGEGMAVNSKGASQIVVPLGDLEKGDLDIVELRRTITETIDRSYNGCSCTLL